MFKIKNFNCGMEALNHLKNYAMVAETISKHGDSSKIHKSRGNFLTSELGGRHFTKNIILAVLCFFTLQLYGQTLEQQLLSQLNQTSNTDLNDNNKWTKIAECIITAAWQDLGGTIEFLGTGSGSTTIYYGSIVARFKNSNANPTTPNFYNLLLFDSNLGTENVKAVMNGTKIDLFIRIPQIHTKVFFRQTLKSFHGPLTTFSNQPFLNSLPPGTVVNCTSGNVAQGTEPNIPFQSSSPVFGARIIYDATFNDPNQLRNIISLRNLNTGGTPTTLRQSGIHLSVSHDYNAIDSEKSAQILLESKNTYANAPSLNFYTKNTQRMTILHDGKVGINTLTPRTQFEVNGVIRATEVRVLPFPADYVFDDDYELRPLEEVEQFIKENRHLPDIPSAAQMEEDEVICIANMNRLLLQKIEELTLYVIDLKKEIDELKK